MRLVLLVIVLVAIILVKPPTRLLLLRGRAPTAQVAVCANFQIGEGMKYPSAMTFSHSLSPGYWFYQRLFSVCKGADIHAPQEPNFAGMFQAKLEELHA